MRDWPAFLLALLGAFALWYSLQERAPVVERSLKVPLQVVGLGEGRRALGLPREVLLRLRGPAPLLEGRALPVSAYLDLSGAEGEVVREVRVAAPQGVEVLEVVPARVGVVVEVEAQRQIPVEVLAQGAWVLTDPAFVEAVGPESQVEAAVSAVGLDLGDEVVLFPLGPEGPLEGVELRPNRVRVVERREALFLKEVPLSLNPPPGRRLLDYAPKTVRLVGPREALEGLAGVTATLQEALGPGEVEVAVAPDLPPGVHTLGPVRVRVALE